MFSKLGFFFLSLLCIDLRWFCFASRFPRSSWKSLRATSGSFSCGCFESSPEHAAAAIIRKRWLRFPIFSFIFVLIFVFTFSFSSVLPTTPAAEVARKTRERTTRRWSFLILAPFVVDCRLKFSSLRFRFPFRQRNRNSLENPKKQKTPS